jgi:hypothetical protein
MAKHIPPLFICLVLLFAAPLILKASLVPPMCESCKSKGLSSCPHISIKDGYCHHQSYSHEIGTGSCDLYMPSWHNPTYSVLDKSKSAPLISSIPGNSESEFFPMQHNDDCNQSLQDNDSTSGVIYDQTKHGLNYTASSQQYNKSANPTQDNKREPLLISKIPKSAVIEKAFLWFEGSGDGKAKIATVNGPQGSINYSLCIIGQGPDKCFDSQGTYTYRADVTSSVRGNGRYNITGILTNLQSSNIKITNAVLVVVWSDATISTFNRVVLGEIQSKGSNCYCEQNESGCLTIFAQKDSGAVIYYQTVEDHLDGKPPIKAKELSDTCAVMLMRKGNYHIWAEVKGVPVTSVDEPEYIDRTRREIYRR